MKTTLETVIRSGKLNDGIIPAIINAAETNTEKAECMIALGDLRYRQYKETRQEKYLRLAKNCFLAARNFQYRELTLQESK